MSQLAGQVHNVVRPITSNHELMDVISAIATSASVTAVNLSHCKFSLDAANGLAQSLVKSSQGHGAVHLVRLVSCSLEASMIEALSAPGACDRLEVIELASNPFSDDACPFLAQIVKHSCLTLKSLDLADCQITAAGIKKFAPVLTMSPSPVLRSLVLTNNELRTPGVATLCEALKNNTSIVDLDISGNCINCDAGDHLARLLKFNKVIQCLSVSANYLSMGASKILAQLANRDVPLRLLDISDNHIDDETCKSAARLLNGSPIDVVCLSIQKNAITNEGFVALYHMLRRSALQFLDVSQLHVTEASSLVISDLIRHCESLGSIQVDGNALGDDAVVEILYAVAQSKNVSAINVERTGLGPRSAEVIANTLAYSHKMRTLNLADNPIDTLCVMKILQGFASAASSSSSGSSSSSKIGSGSGNSSSNISSLREASQSKLELLDLSNLPLPETENVQAALLELFVHNLHLKEITLDFCGVSVNLPNRKLTREIVDKLTAAKKAATSSSSSSTSASAVDGDESNLPPGATPTSRALALALNNSFAKKNNNNEKGQLTTTSSSSSSSSPNNKQSVKHRPMHRPAWAPVTAAYMRGGGHRNNNNHGGNNSSYQQQQEGGSGGSGGGALMNINQLADEIDDSEAEDITHLPYEPNPNSLMHSLYPSFGYGRFSNASSVSSLSHPLPFNMSHGKLAHKAIFPPRGDGSHLFAQAPRRSAMKSLFSLDQLEKNVGQLPVTDEQLRLKFSELDTEGVGSLPRDEFIQFYKSLQGFGIPHSDKEVSRVMSKYLSKGNNRVTYDEFCLVMLNFATR